MILPLRRRNRRRGIHRLKLLLVHNFYQSSSPSGEDTAFRSEVELLRAGGLVVETYVRHNDEIRPELGSRVSAALNGLWSARTHRDLLSLLRDFRPDLAHFHGTFPLVSPSGYAACKASGVPVVQTFHNYRSICPNGLLLRNGVPCEDCLGRLPLPAVQHACYRSSRLATLLAAGISVANARAFHRHSVDQFIALTDFAADLFARSGVPRDRIAVRPNCLDTDPPVGSGDGGFVLYAGRLSQEKGVRVLLQAWTREGLPECVVVGDGPLRLELEQESRRRQLRIRFLGSLPRSEVIRLMRMAAAVVIPSICYEGLPMVFLESMASGTPVACSDIGGLASLVADADNGAKYPAGDSQALAASVLRIIGDGTAARRLRGRCRSIYDEHYATNRARERLLGIYERTMARHRSQPRIS
jgi:glycosyltransferase involved in cell wall biosynthesis